MYFIAFFFSPGSNQDLSIAFGCYTFFVSLMDAEIFTVPYLLLSLRDVDFFFFQQGPVVLRYVPHSGFVCFLIRISIKYSWQK